MNRLLALLVAGIVSTGVLAQNGASTMPITPIATATQASPKHAQPVKKHQSAKKPKTVKKHKAVGHQTKKHKQKSKKRAKKL